APERLQRGPPAGSAYASMVAVHGIAAGAGESVGGLGLLARAVVPMPDCWGQSMRSPLPPAERVAYGIHRRGISLCASCCLPGFRADGIAPDDRGHLVLAVGGPPAVPRRFGSDLSLRQTASVGTVLACPVDLGSSAQKAASCSRLRRGTGDGNTPRYSFGSARI